MEMMASEKDFLFGWFGSENTGDDALLDQTFSICLDDIKLNEIYDEISHSDICEKKINENLEKEKAKLHEKMLKKYLNP